MDQQNNNNGDRPRDEPEPKRTRDEYSQQNLVAPGTSRGNNAVVRDTFSRQGDPSAVHDSSGRVLILNSGGTENHEVVASNSLACYLPQSQGNQNQVALPSQSTAIFRPWEQTSRNEANTNFPVASRACIINPGIMLQDGTGSQAVPPVHDNRPMYIFGSGKESMPGPSNQVAGVNNHGNIQVGKMKVKVKVGSKAPQSEKSPQLRIEFNLQDSIRTFTGRVDVLDRLHKAIQNNRQKATQTILSQVIVGIGGIGKTETTRKYANDSRDFYWHRLWINAETYSEAKRCFLEVALRMKLSINDLEGNPKQMDFVLEDIYDSLCKNLCLIIFDNANSMDTSEGEDGIRPFLPKTIKSGWEYPAILVTSRNRNWGPIQVIPLDGLDDSECYELLKSQLMFQDTDENRSWARQITSLCEGLPLVVQQVIAVVREESLIREYTLETFLEDFERKQEKCVKALPADSNIGASVFTIFNMAFERLASKPNGKLATQCLDVMALLNPDNIPVNLLHELLEPEVPKDVSDALLLLHKHNLVTLYTGSCKIHRVIQLVKTIATPAEEAASHPGQNCADIRTVTIAKFTNFILKLPETKELLKTENLSHILENGVTLVKHIFERPFQIADCDFVAWLSKKLDYYNNNRKLDKKEASSSFAISKKRVSEGVKFNVLEPIDTFTGREDVLEQINTIMSEVVAKNNPNKVLKFKEIWKDTVVLVGDAGVGKTETVRKYIKLYGYHFKHILWLNAETESQARECLLETASIMQVPMSDSSGNAKPFNSILKEVYQILFKDTCLMVFDNFEIDICFNNFKTFFPQYYISAPKLPCVIVTNRYSPEQPTCRIIEMLATHNRIENNGFLQELQFEESEENRELAKFVENIIIWYLNPVTLSVLFVCIREKCKDCLVSNGKPFTLKEFVFEVFGEEFKVVPYSNMQWCEQKLVIKQLHNFILSCIEGKEDGKLALDCFITMTLLYPDRIPITLLDYLLQPESEKLSEVLFLLETFKLIRRHGHFCTIHREIQKFGREYQNIWKYNFELTNAGVECVSERALHFTKYLDEMKFDDSSLNIALENAIYFSQAITSGDFGVVFPSQILVGSKILDFHEFLIKKLFLNGRYLEVASVCDCLCAILRKNNKMKKS